MSDPWDDFLSKQSKAPIAAPAAPAPALAAPAAGADPWDDYLKAGAARATPAPAAAPAAAAPASPDAPLLPGQTAQDRAYDPNWKPSGSAMLDFFTRPRAKTEGFSDAAHDFGLSALDYGSFGYAVPNAWKNDVDQAHQNLGIMDYPTAALAYGAGPGKILGPIARTVTGAVVPGASAGAGWLARTLPSIVAGGGEGAAAGGLGAAGHGGDASDIAKGAGYGALGGAAGGALGGSGPTPKAPDVGIPKGTDPTGVPIAPTGMYAAREAAYGPLDSIGYDTHRAAIQRGDAAIQALRNPQGWNAPVDIPTDVSKIVGDLSQAPQVTGGNLQRASRALRDTGDITGHRYADQLDNVLRYDQPLMTPGGTAPPGVTLPSSGQGVVNSGGQSFRYNNGQVTASGPSPGQAWAAKQEGDMWHGRIQGLERLDQDTPSGTPGPTPSAVAKTASYYPDAADQFGNYLSPERQALSNLRTAQKPGFNAWHLRHPLGALAGGAVGAAEDFIDPGDHPNPWQNALLHAGTGMALFSGLPALAAARPGRALNAARYAIGTGQPISTPTGQIGDALVNMFYGKLAGGQP